MSLKQRLNKIEGRAENRRGVTYEVIIGQDCEEISDEFPSSQHYQQTVYTITVDENGQAQSKKEHVVR